MFVQSENSGGLKTLVLSSLILFESAVALVAATSSYEIVDLGTLGGDFSSATAINQSGQVVGTASTADGTKRAFLWSLGTMRDLGSLGGSNSHAAAINSTGKVAGWAETTSGNSHACTFDGATVVDLHPPRFKNSYAQGINDAGVVVGRAATGETIFRILSGNLFQSGSTPDSAFPAPDFE